MMIMRCARILLAVGLGWAALSAGARGETAGVVAQADLLPVHTVIVRDDGRVVKLWLVVFSPETHDLVVVDNPPNPGAGALAGHRHVDLMAGMVATGCVAGVNGGFFRADVFAPAGFMVAEGVTLARFEPRSWMTGLVLLRPGGAELRRTADFVPEQHTDLRGALQTGPWLVRAGVAEPDNSRSPQAKRTFVGNDGAGRWFVGMSEACSLHELATWLRHPDVQAVVPVQNALNLDGGTSSTLWARTAEGNFYKEAYAEVRNYLGVRPRDRMAIQLNLRPAESAAQ
jgi:uncharacterized protein YigE (DUF2233 family)